MLRRFVSAVAVTGAIMVASACTAYADTPVAPMGRADTVTVTTTATGCFEDEAFIVLPDVTDRVCVALDDLQSGKPIALEMLLHRDSGGNDWHSRYATEEFLKSINAYREPTHDHDAVPNAASGMAGHAIGKCIAGELEYGGDNDYWYAPIALEADGSISCR